MGSEEHVIGLDGSANEQASQRDHWQAETPGETLFGKRLSG